MQEPRLDPLSLSSVRLHNHSLKLALIWLVELNEHAACAILSQCRLNYLAARKMFLVNWHRVEELVDGFSFDVATPGPLRRLERPNVNELFDVSLSI